MWDALLDLYKAFLAGRAYRSAEDLGVSDDAMQPLIVLGYVVGTLSSPPSYRITNAGIDAAQDLRAEARKAKEMSR
jgi:hypothetical protein